MSVNRRVIILSAVLGTLWVAPFAIIYWYGTLDFTDLTFYATSAQFFSDQFWHGELYPRWINAFNAGLGAPVFFFYPPVTAYLSTPLHFLSGIDPDGVLRLLIGIGFATALSGITSYAWFSRWMEPRTAFTAALIYVCMPFRLQYIYIDFNLAQCWAIAWFPLILLQLDRLIEKQRYAIVGLSLSVALLIYTHIPSCVVFMPMLPVLLLARSPVKQWPALMFKFALCMVLAGGMTGFYLAPLLANRDAIDVAVQQQGKYNYAANFQHEGIRFSVPVLSVLCGLVWVITPPPQRRKIFVWMVLLAVYLFMMTPFSFPIWEVLPPLQALQFPFIRLYAGLFIVLPVLFAHGLSYCGTEDIYRRRQARILAALFVPFVAAHLYFTHTIYADVRQWPRERTPEIMQTMQDVHDSRIVGAWEYRPVGVNKDTLTMESLLKWKKANAGEHAKLVDGDGSFTIDEWNPREVVVKMHVTSEKATLELYRLFFPGWSVYKGDDPIPAVPYASGFYGFIQIDVPKGDYTLTFALDRVPGMEKGLLMTLLALVAVLLVFLMDLRSSHVVEAEPEKSGAAS